MTAVIVLLLIVAALLTMLTIWYWRYTSPKRRARAAAATMDYGPDELDLTAPPTEVYPVVRGDQWMEPQHRNLR